MKKILYHGKFQVLLALIIASILIITSCSSAAPAKPAVAPAVDAGPKYGGTLRVAYNMDINTLDSIMSTSIIDRALGYLYGDTLVRWSGKNDEAPKLVPHLAEKWEIAPDGMSYTFYLQKGVKFQNLPPVNGRECTAADFKYSLERIKDPKTKSPMAPYMASIASVEAPDKYTLKLVMKTPDPAMLTSLAGPNTSVLAREAIEQEGGAGNPKNIIGTGPFIIDKYTKGSGITFKRNPDYWIKGKPYLDSVECIYMPDPSARLAAFRAGQLDRVIEGKTSADLIKNSVPGANLVPGIALLGSGLVFNLGMKDKPWANVKVRQALQYAIDYDGLIQAVLDGAGARTDFLHPTAFADYGARPVAELPKKDLAKAKALLAEAGYPNGFKAAMVQHTTRMDAWGGAVEPLAAMLKEVGVDITIVPVGQADYVAKIRSGDFELMTSVVLATQPELDSNLSPMYKTKGAYNRAQFSNARVDELLALEAQNFTDTAQRQKYAKEIMQILAEQVPVIPLYYNYNTHITQPWVKGWDNAADPPQTFSWYQLANVWIDKK